MMGIRLPKKLPSRNWMIFLTAFGSLSAAITYDRREKDKAILRWAKSIAHVAKEPLPNPSQLPRKLTVYLEAPPGDNLRITQEHYKEYVKPVLAASGLDWEFVQGRREGDIRAAVAERIRRTRRRQSGDDVLPTDEDMIQDMRQERRIPEYQGTLGDIIIGRHTWKEYVRGLHEGWLGPLEPPETEAVDKLNSNFPETSEVKPPAETPFDQADQPTPIYQLNIDENGSDTSKPLSTAVYPEKKAEERKETSKTPERPKQPISFNKVSDYPCVGLPPLAPQEFAPVSIIAFPFMLGFSRTPKRVWRYMHRRELAEQIGREVAAAVLATYREFYEDGSASSAAVTVSTDNQHDHYGRHQPYEQQGELAAEEECWVKSVWKEATAHNTTAATDDHSGRNMENGEEKIWAKPVVMDARIASRMRRFEILPADEERAKSMVVKEEEIEGWTKGSLRSLCRWCLSLLAKKENEQGPMIAQEYDGNE